VPKVAARPELNATAASILGFLRLAPMTGLELMSTIDNVIGDFWHVTKSQIDRELKLLAENDLVETLATGARDKRPYQITPRGRNAFRAWIRRPPEPPIMRMPIMLEVFFGGEVPFDELRRHVEAMRAHHDERLRVYETFVPQAPKGTWPHEALRLGFMFQRAMIEWLDTLPKEPLPAAGPLADDERLKERPKPKKRR
jgi:DNA-binding PadR family transcriptional regulator